MQGHFNQPSLPFSVILFSLLCHLLVLKAIRVEVPDDEARHDPLTFQLAGHLEEAGYAASGCV